MIFLNVLMLINHWFSDIQYMTAQVLVLILSKLTSSVEIKLLAEKKKNVFNSQPYWGCLPGVGETKKWQLGALSSVLGLLLEQNLFRFSDLRKRRVQFLQPVVHSINIILFTLKRKLLLQLQSLVAYSRYLY